MAASCSTTYLQYVTTHDDGPTWTNRCELPKGSFWILLPSEFWERAGSEPRIRVLTVQYSTLCASGTKPSIAFSSTLPRLSMIRQNWRTHHFGSWHGLTAHDARYSTVPMSGTVTYITYIGSIVSLKLNRARRRGRRGATGSNREQPRRNLDQDDAWFWRWQTFPNTLHSTSSSERTHGHRLDLVRSRVTHLTLMSHCSLTHSHPGPMEFSFHPQNQSTLPIWLSCYCTLASSNSMFFQKCSFGGSSSSIAVYLRSCP